MALGEAGDRLTLVPAFEALAAVAGGFKTPAFFVFAADLASGRAVGGTGFTDAAPPVCAPADLGAG